MLIEDSLFNKSVKNCFLVFNVPNLLVNLISGSGFFYAFGGGSVFPPTPLGGGGGISNLDQGQLSPFKQIYAWQRLDPLAQFSNATAKINF
jgi:hypothetical protein